MSFGYVYIYFGGDDVVPPSLTSLEALLAPLGVSLELPGTSEVFLLTEGGRVIVSRNDVDIGVKRGHGVTFQWWFNDSEDLVCGVNRPWSDSRWRVDFSLNGVRQKNSNLLIESAVRFFRYHCGRGAGTALLVDRYGGLSDIDWDAVMNGQEPVTCVPDLFIAPRTVVGRAADHHNVESLVGCPDHVILTHRDKLEEPE